MCMWCVCVHACEMCNVVYICMCMSMCVRERVTCNLVFKERGAVTDRWRKVCLVSHHLASWTGDFITQFTNSVFFSTE